MTEKYVKEATNILDKSTATVASGALLEETRIYDTLISAVRKKLIGRQFARLVLGPEAVPGGSIDINLQTPESMTVFKVSEGAEVPLDTEAYTTFTVTPSKYGVRILINDEMSEDSKFDLLRLNIETAGYKLADNEDTLIINELDTASSNAGNTVTGGTAATISDILTAAKNLRDNRYQGKVLLLGSEVLLDLQQIDTFVEADKVGNRDTLANGFQGRIYGLDVVFSHNVDSKSAYVIDPDHAFMLVEKRPITMETYRDAARGSTIVVVTQRIAARRIREEAVSKITTS